MWSPYMARPGATFFGIKTHVADLVGDGRADLLVGAFYADAPERANAGKLYIFSAELIARLRAAGRRLDLAQRPWPEGLITRYRR